MSVVPFSAFKAGVPAKSSPAFSFTAQEYGDLQTDYMAAMRREARQTVRADQLHEALAPFAESPVQDMGDGMVGVRVSRKQWYDAQLALQWSRLETEHGSES